MYQIINTMAYNKSINLALTLENAQLHIIQIYLKNVNKNFYSLNTKEYGFDYDKLLLLQKINQLVIDKKYAEASELILNKFKELSIIDLLGVKEPKPLDQKEIEDAVKTCIFDGFNDEKNKFNNSTRLIVNSNLVKSIFDYSYNTELNKIEK